MKLVIQLMEGEEESMALTLHDITEESGEFVISAIAQYFMEGRFPS